MLRDLRRDVPGFVWLTGLAGVIALVAGYRLDLDSKWGDGLRELGWLGLAVLVTVAGVDIAQRRARAGRWKPVVSDLRLEARQLTAELVGALVDEFSLGMEGLSLMLRAVSLKAEDSIEADLEVADETLLQALTRLWTVVPALRRADLAPHDADWRQVTSQPRVLFTGPRTDSLHGVDATAARLVAVVERLVEVSEDPALASRHNELRRRVDALAPSRARAATDSIVVVDVTMVLEARQALAGTLDAIASAALKAHMLVGHLRKLEPLLRD